METTNDRRAKRSRPPGPPPRASISAGVTRGGVNFRRRADSYGNHERSTSEAKSSPETTTTRLYLLRASNARWGEFPRPCRLIWKPRTIDERSEVVRRDHHAPLSPRE